MLVEGIAQFDTLTVDNGQAVVGAVPTIRYQYRDHLGSSVIEANELGQVVSVEEYYPHGVSAYRAAASGVDLSLKRYRFTGKERDEETGLDYFGVRYYAPWLGRWTSGDPGGFVDGLNLYRYVRNNPVNGVDLEGYSTEPVENLPALRIDTEIQENTDPPKNIVNPNYELLGLNDNFKGITYAVYDNYLQLPSYGLIGEGYRIYSAVNERGRSVGFFAVRAINSVRAANAAPFAHKTLELRPEWFIHKHGLDEFLEALQTQRGANNPDYIGSQIHAGGFTQAEKDYLNGKDSAWNVIVSNWKDMQTVQGWTFALVESANMMAVGIPKRGKNARIDDLGELIVDCRKTLGKDGGGATKSNFAAIEYLDDAGNINYVISKSQFNGYHAEKYGMAYVLGVEGIPANRVLRLHTELQPCRSCGPAIENFIPETKVTYQFPYYKKPGSRSYTGKEAHNKYIENIFN